MEGYRPGEQPQGTKVIKLNTNENPYPPSSRAIQAMRHSAGDGLIRYPSAMADAFRVRAAAHWQVEPDWILCGNGSDDLLTILTRTFVGPGDTLRLPYPSYILYRTLAEIQGAKFDEIQFNQDWSLAAGFGAATDGLKLVFLPNPNSPSGTVIPPDQILAFAKRLPCPLVVDEAYADFATTHCVDLVKEDERIIVTRTLSKAYGLAGLRFGYLIAQPQMVAEMAKVKDSYNCDAISIAGATAAIDDQDWLEDNRRRIVATRERLQTELAQLGFSTQPSQANFVWATHETPLQPVYEQLKSRGILVRYMPYAGWGEGVRISVGTDSQTDALLSVLKSIL